MVLVVFVFVVLAASVFVVSVFVVFVGMARSATTTRTNVDGFVPLTQRVASREKASGTQLWQS